MSGHYSAPCVADKLYACKKCGKMPTVGQVRYYEKSADGNSWLGCVDLECFISQGGSKDPAQKSGGGKYQANKFPITEATKLYDLAETILDSFLKKREEPDRHVLKVEEQAIFIESLIRTLSGNFKP